MKKAISRKASQRTPAACYLPVSGLLLFGALVAPLKADSSATSAVHGAFGMDWVAGLLGFDIDSADTGVIYGYGNSSVAGDVLGDKRKHVDSDLRHTPSALGDTAASPATPTPGWKFSDWSRAADGGDEPRDGFQPGANQDL